MQQELLCLRTASLRMRAAARTLLRYHLIYYVPRIISLKSSIFCCKIYLKGVVFKISLRAHSHKSKQFNISDICGDQKTCLWKLRDFQTFCRRDVLLLPNTLLHILIFILKSNEDY
jgi:hypothetical protein